MKKLLKNKNVLLVVGLLVICAAVLAVATLVNTEPETLPEVPTLSEDVNMPAGYILAQKNGDGGWIPLATGEDMVVSISDENDPGIKNVLRITKNGFRMESSTCDNQDCVDQGEVTLENMSERVLMNMVICLPHQLSVELYSIEQLVEMSVSE